MKDTNIAITGASGFIGSHLSDHLLRTNNYTLYLISNRIDLINENIAHNDNIKIIKGNIGEDSVQRIIVENRIGIIINLCAQTDVYYAEDNVYDDYNISVIPIIKLLSFFTKEKYECTFIQFGTVTQCGFTPKTPINEEYADSPISVFDYHKLCAENYVKYFNDNSCINGFCFRLSNVYGGNNQFFSSNRGVINKVIKMSFKNQTISVYGDGNYLRDYIHIDDVVKYISYSITQKEELYGRHIFLCNGNSYTIKEVWNMIADLILKHHSIKVIVKNKEWPKNILDIEKRDFVADNSLLIRKLGSKPRINIKDGLYKNITLVYKGL